MTGGTAISRGCRARRLRPESHRRLLSLRPELFPKGPPDSRSENRDAVDFFLRQAGSSGSRWTAGRARRSSPSRFNASATRKRTRDIMKSIKERSVSDDELGMYWRDLELSWWWYRAPIETQAHDDRGL